MAELKLHKISCIIHVLKTERELATPERLSEDPERGMPQECGGAIWIKRRLGGKYQDSSTAMPETN